MTGRNNDDNSKVIQANIVFSSSLLCLSNSTFINLPVPLIFSFPSSLLLSICLSSSFLFPSFDSHIFTSLPPFCSSVFSHLLLNLHLFPFLTSAYPFLFISTHFHLSFLAPLPASPPPSPLTPTNILFSSHLPASHSSVSFHRHPSPIFSPSLHAPVSSILPSLLFFCPNIHHLSPPLLPPSSSLLPVLSSSFRSSSSSTRLCQWITMSNA